MNRKRLLIRAPNWLGDCLLTLPAIDALRRALPDAHFTVLARETLAGMWQMTPVDDMMPFACRPGLAGIGDRRACARLLKAARFDAALVLPNSFDAALVPFLARIPDRAGWATNCRSLLLTRRFTCPPQFAEVSQARKYVNLVEQWLGRTVDATLDVRLRIPDDVAQRVQDAKAAMRPLLIGVNPGSTYGPAKRWIAARFAEMARHAHGLFEAQIILFGGPGDEAVCAEVAQAITRDAADAASWCTNLAGKTTLKELAAWLAACECLVTNDTGTMHMAAAVGTQVVAIFGPTDWRTTAPLGARHALVRVPVECAPCLERSCPRDHRCMKEVTTEMVLGALAGACRRTHGGGATSSAQAGRATTAPATQNP